MTPSSKSLPAGAVIPIFLLITFVGPMLIGPLLYEALRPFHIPFHRAMNRALLFAALAALFIFRRRLHLRAWWPFDRAAGLQLALGWFIAFVSGQLMIGIYLAACGFHAAPVSPVHTLLVATMAALIVPILEETIFRGFLVGTLRESVGARLAWILAALVYALAHFLKIPSDFHADPIRFSTGAEGMASAFGQLGTGDFLGGRGLNLLLVGLILGGVFLRVGRLWLCAGLHSGWIFVLMTFTGLTRPDKPLRNPWLGADLLGSPVATGVLIATGLFLWRYYPPKNDEEAQKESTRTG
jgi:membrane protease YdiL (CAAX protease family)